jgi:hypothetical protein
MQAPILDRESAGQTSIARRKRAEVAISYLWGVLESLPGKGLLPEGKRTFTNKADKGQADSKAFYNPA